MILGIDVSTSKIGYCVLDDKQNLLEVHFKKLKEDTLEDKAWKFFSNELKDIDRKYKIKEVRIEEPFTMFSGGKTTAGTMAKLQRFNGMISLMTYHCFNMVPILVPSRSARSKCGIKIKRGENTKKKIIEWVEQKYPKDFIVELTRHGNPKPGTDDMADSVVVALSHF
jgi:Holliday junction resolvasome RuvABC endonuclease subunit